MDEYEKVFYFHDPGCDPKKDLSTPNDRGLRNCRGCAGMFDEEGKGVLVNDKRFDKPRDI